MANKIQYKPFINNDSGSENNVKSLITNKKSDLILPKQQIQTSEIETYVPQFQLKEPEKPKGKIEFKSKDIQIGNTQSVLDQFSNAGINLRITSGLRPGAKTKQGNESWHGRGEALDITPIEGETFDDLKAKLKSNPDLVKWLQDNGYGIIDETTPEVLKRTGGTGAHWHLGKDKLAIEGLQKLLLKKGGKLASQILKGQGGLKNDIAYKPYIVKRGENLSNIAESLGVPLNTLVSTNNIENPDKIYAGQELNIPKLGYQPVWDFKQHMLQLKDAAEGPGSGVSLRPDQVEETEKNERASDILSRVSKKGQSWDANMINFIDETFKNHRIPTSVIYDLIDSESGFNPQAKNRHSSASGLFQIIQSTAKGLYGEEIAREYANQTRSFHNQIRDAVKLLDSHTKNISDSDLDYGRIKIAMLGPSYRMDQIIPNNVWTNSLSDTIKKKVPKGSTFEKLREVYNSGIKN